MLIPLKDYIYLGLIAALIAGGIYLRAHLIDEGEAKARAAEVKAAAIQKQKDDTLNANVTQELNDEIKALSNAPVPVIPVVVCHARGVPKAHSAPGTAVAIEPAPASGRVPGVPAGNSGPGQDVGPLLQQLAQAADLISARNRACLAWAKGL